MKTATSILLVIASLLPTPDLLAQDAGTDGPAATARPIQPRPAVQVAILAKGPPDLTVDAADAYLNSLAFMVSAVNGGRTITIDSSFRTAWRAYVAAGYAGTAIDGKLAIANAPASYAQMRAGWAALNLAEQDATRQLWVQCMPTILNYVEPLVSRAEQASTEGSFAWQTRQMLLAQRAMEQQLMAAQLLRRMLENLEQMRGGMNQALESNSGSPAAAYPAPAPAPDAESEALRKLANHSAVSTTLQTGLNASAASTINLMRSYSGRR